MQVPNVVNLETLSQRCFRLSGVVFAPNFFQRCPTSAAFGYPHLIEDDVSTAFHELEFLVGVTGIVAPQSVSIGTAESTEDNCQASDHSKKGAIIARL